jgi:hypothetical protein
MIRLRERHAARSRSQPPHWTVSPACVRTATQLEALVACTRARPGTRPGRVGQQTGSKRLKSASLNHAESHHEKAGKPHE